MTLVELINEDYKEYFAIHPNSLHYELEDHVVFGVPSVKNTATVSKDLGLCQNGWHWACLGIKDGEVIVDFDRRKVELKNIPFKVIH